MTKIKIKAPIPAKHAQAAKKKHLSSKTPLLENELIQLIDDFAEFSDISAFLCNAYATTLADHERLNQEIISGARICSVWLQSRTSKLKADIQDVHARYAAESQK